MNPVIFIFLSSGLFLGWSLGANDAANVFGTAVGSRMLRFRTAALTCSVFVVLGAVFGGSGAAHGLGALGAVNALPGAFMVALSAAVTVYAMTKLGLPVSTTQAIVGAILGWNVFSASVTDERVLTKIVGTWIACPVLAAVFSAVLYMVVAGILRWRKPHMIRLDMFTRFGLILTGAFGAYSLGANNIGNVMGVFIVSSPFRDVNVGGVFTLRGIEQLFLLGGLAIAVGVFYSRRVMMTVGESIMTMSPIGAWVVVVAQSLVLFVFSSRWLEHVLLSHGLPALPLIPVSSSQAVVGAVIGIGLCHGIRGAAQIRWLVLLRIGSGWVTTPVISSLICYVMLFVLQNVFQQQVCEEVRYELSPEVATHLATRNIPITALREREGTRAAGSARFRRLLRGEGDFTPREIEAVIEASEIAPIRIDPKRVVALDQRALSDPQLQAVATLARRSFLHHWQFALALAEQTEDWRFRPDTRDNRAHNRAVRADLDYVCRVFRGVLLSEE